MAASGLPPWGGSGLKLISEVDDATVSWGLPPWGGSGLKFAILIAVNIHSHVSLLGEGVD